MLGKWPLLHNELTFTYNNNDLKTAFLCKNGVVKLSNILACNISDLSHNQSSAHCVLLNHQFILETYAKDALK